MNPYDPINDPLNTQIHYDNECKNCGLKQSDIEVKLIPEIKRFMYHYLFLRLTMLFTVFYTLVLLAYLTFRGVPDIEWDYKEIISPFERIQCDLSSTNRITVIQSIYILLFSIMITMLPLLILRDVIFQDLIVAFSCTVSALNMWLEYSDFICPVTDGKTFYVEIIFNYDFKRIKLVHGLLALQCLILITYLCLWIHEFKINAIKFFDVVGLKLLLKIIFLKKIEQSKTFICHRGTDTKNLIIPLMGKCCQQQLLILDRFVDANTVDSVLRELCKSKNCVVILSERFNESKYSLSEIIACSYLNIPMCFYLYSNPQRGIPFGVSCYYDFGSPNNGLETVIHGLVLK